MAAVRLIWCQGGNPASARIAVAAGFWYGFRSDSNHYADELGPVALLDSHWEEGRVDWSRHLDVCARLRPALATAPDTLSLDDLDRTLRQAGEIAAYANPLIVPKCEGMIRRLPREINGRPVTLGYSVPTSYGGSELPLWDYTGWPVHLLGGSPRRQAEVCRYLDVVSADGNVTWLLARRGIVTGENGAGGKTLRQADGQRWPHGNAPLEALRRSLANLRVFWDTRRLGIEWRTG